MRCTSFVCTIGKALHPEMLFKSASFQRPLFFSSFIFALFSMKLSSSLVSWIVIAALPALAAASSLYVELAPLFRSNPLRYHPSPEHFERIAEKYAKHILSHASSNTGIVPSTAVTSTTHTFIVKHQEQCHHRCHEKLSKHFGEHRYEIISADVGILTASLQELREYRHSFSQLSTTSTTPQAVVDYVPLHPEMKVSPEVHNIVTNLAVHCKANKNEPVNLIILVPGLTTEEYNRFHTNLLTQFNRYNGVVKYETSFPYNQFVEQTRFRGFVSVSDCSLTETVVTFLSNQPQITWIEPNNPLAWHNRWSNGVCDSGTTEITPLDDWNITGDGEVIAISDTGIDMKNCFFYDPNHKTPYDVVNLNHRKVVYYRTTDGDGFDDNEEAHGTHVAGSAAGRAYQSYGDYSKFRGMASGAKIAFADLYKGSNNKDGSVKLPSDIKALFVDLGKTGARIFTNSWGTKNANAYDSNAQAVDIFMRSTPEALVLFSAGNDGASGRNTVNSPSTNKNGISVGASLNDREAWQGLYATDNPPEAYNKDGVAYFSSQGPTTDNRLKPDILAPGYYVFSAKGRYNVSSVHCEIQGKSGTSMSAPTMAGFAAKVRQYYREGYYPTGKANSSNGFIPSGALIKATLIHSGQPMANLVKDKPTEVTALTAYPSTIQGYGRIQLNEVLNFGKSTRNPITMFVVGGATASDGHYEQFTITGESDLYTFTTSSESPQAAIRVTLCYTDKEASPSTTNVMVNVLTLSVTSSRGASFTPLTASGTVKSNVQVIDIASPTVSTTYTVKINADTITSSPQPYALVVTGKLTYLNATGSSTGSDKDDSKPRLSYNTSKYIIVMAVVCFVLFASYYHFYRVSKENLLLDPRNYGNYDPLDFEDVEGGKKNTTLFQRIFTRGKKRAPNQRR